VTVGAAAVDALRQVRADACVLGICSLHPELGVTATDHDEAHVKRAMVEASAEVIALATADKLRTAGPWVVAPLARVTHLVTDAGEELTAEYANAGVSVVHA
jgi:DeoR/GlpR family transcriptional regulator of sugar metabolism